VKEASEKGNSGKTTVCAESVSCQEILSSHCFPAGNILPGGAPLDPAKGSVYNSTIKTNTSELREKENTSQNKWLLL
jgi:hypothetical protein